jgi:deoxyribonuclease II
MLSDPSGLLTGTKGAPLTGYLWSYTRDHAKWAISEEDQDRGVEIVQTRGGKALANKPGTVSDWICVADMNRMTSQEKRGGGAICFHEPLLWHGLNEIERISGNIT